MKKLLLLLPFTALVMYQAGASPKKHHHFFHRHKHKARITKRKDILHAADVVSFEPA